MNINDSFNTWPPPPNKNIRILNSLNLYYTFFFYSKVKSLLKRWIKIVTTLQWIVSTSNKHDIFKKKEIRCAWLRKHFLMCCEFLGYGCMLKTHRHRLNNLAYWTRCPTPPTSTSPLSCHILLPCFFSDIHSLYRHTATRWQLTKD